MSNPTCLQQYRFRYLFYGIMLFFIGFGILLIMATIGWSGEPDPCIANNSCFCEPIYENTLFVQPNNTWSNLYICLAGFGILYLIGKNKDQKISEQHGVPEQIQLFYGFLAVSIGLTSMFFHASLRWWGDFLDLTSMNIYVSMLILYDISIFRKWSVKRYFIILLLVNIFLAIILQLNAEFGVMLFTILVSIIFLFETGILISIHKFPFMRWLYRNWRWFAIGMTLYTFGTFIWIFSNTGMPLCDPDSFWQGHGFWHFFDGTAIFLFFLYIKTEKKKFD